MNTTTDTNPELAVLTVMFDDAAAAATAIDLLSAEDFRTPAYATMFAVLRRMAAAGGIDQHLVPTEIKKLPRLEQAAAEIALQDVLRADAHPIRIEEYCRSIKAATHARALNNKLQGVRQKIAAGAQPGDLAHALHDAAVTAEHGTRAPVITGSVGLLGNLLAEAKAGRRNAIPFPWPALSAATRALMQATVTVFSGKPGGSKSLLLTQCLAFWAAKGIRASVLELEDGTVHHQRRVLAQLAGEAEVTNDEWCFQHPDELDRLSAEHNGELSRIAPCLHEFHRDAEATPEIALDWIATQARDRARIIAVDPFTLLSFGDKPWIGQKNFIVRAKRIVEAAGCSLILVTHPRKVTGDGRAGATLDDIAGAADLPRFAQTVLWLEAHNPKTENVRTAHGTCEMEFNRTLRILKARNSWGQGLSIAMKFSAQTLRTEELGAID